MKNYLLNLMTILMVAIVSVGFVSCGDDKENGGTASPLVGTWTYTNQSGVYVFDIYTFKSDGTYKYVGHEGTSTWEESGTWKYNENHNELTLHILESYDIDDDDDDDDEPIGPYFERYIVALIGNQMTLIFDDGDVWGPFTKQ